MRPRRMPPTRVPASASPDPTAEAAGCRHARGREREAVATGPNRRPLPSCDICPAGRVRRPAAVPPVGTSRREQSEG